MVRIRNPFSFPLGPPCRARLDLVVFVYSKVLSKEGIFLGIGELLDFFLWVGKNSLGWKLFLWVEIFFRRLATQRKKSLGSNPKKHCLRVQTNELLSEGQQRAK